MISFAGAASVVPALTPIILRRTSQLWDDLRWRNMMTSILPAVPEPQPTRPAFDYDKWQEDAKHRREAIAKKVAAAKTALFDIFESHGIAFVVVGFDGCGDSGQIDGILAHDECGIVDLPDVKLPAIDIETVISGAGTIADTGDMTIADVIETLAYDLLASEHGGWENNDGAYGEFRFDTADHAITLGYNERFTSSEYSENSW